VEQTRNRKCGNKFESVAYYSPIRHSDLGRKDPCGSERRSGNPVETHDGRDENARR